MGSREHLAQTRSKRSLHTVRRGSNIITIAVWTEIEKPPTHSAFPTFPTLSLIPCLHTCTHTQRCKHHTYMYSYIHSCMHAYHTNAYICIHMSSYTYMYVDVYVHTHACIPYTDDDPTQMQSNRCTYMHVNVHIHVHTNVHACTHSSSTGICQSLTFSNTTVQCNLLSCLMCVVTYLLTDVWRSQWVSGDGWSR